MFRRRLASPALGLLLAIGLLPASPAGAAPLTSQEIVLDHGFRYRSRSDQWETVSIARRDTTLLLAFRDAHRGGITAYRRNATGAEIDINGRDIVPDDDACRFDLSDFDGSGWKVAFADAWSWTPQAGPTALTVRDLDPSTLDVNTERVLDPPGGGSIANVEIESGNGFHVVLWLDDSSGVRIQRIGVDLELIDETPQNVAASFSSPSADLAMTSAGGVVACIENGRAWIRLLDASGSLVGPPIDLGPAGPENPEIAVAPHGSDWLVAVNRATGIEWLWVDADGTPGRRFNIPGHEASYGLSVCASDSLALLAWRQGWDWSTIHALRLDRNGSVGTILDLDEESPYWPEYPDPDRRNVSCAWTGERFVVLWNAYLPLPTRPGSPLEGCDGAFPILSQWIREDGAFNQPEPIVVSQISYPWGGLIQKTPAGYLAILPDAAGTPPYLHTMSVDSLGVPGPGSRFWFAGDWDECPLWDVNSWYSTGGFSHRPWGLDGAVLCSYTTGWSGPLGEWVESKYVLVDRLSPDGIRVGHLAVPVCSAHSPAGCPGPTSFDVAPGAESSIVAYSVATEPDSGRVVLLDNESGNPIRAWDIDTPNPVTAITTAPITADRTLLVWLETLPDGARLCRALLDHPDPSGVVAGEPIGPAAGAPWLIPGPAQCLLVYPSDGDGGTDIYALRLDNDGVPMDAQPIALCRLPGDQGWVQGIWDGYQYMVTYRGGSDLLGNRIASDGIVIDDDGFVIAESVETKGQVTSDLAGHIAVAYKGNRIRLIDDPIPLLDDEDPWGPEDPTTPDTTATTTAVRIGSLLGNPARGPVRLDLSLPAGMAASITVLDAAGREVASARVIPRGEDPVDVWNGTLANGRPAPAGLYVLVVRAGSTVAVRKTVLIR